MYFCSYNAQCPRKLQTVIDLFYALGIIGKVILERLSLPKLFPGKAWEREIFTNHADTKRRKDSERRFAVALFG
jgi:hypothetical protein